MQDGHVTSACDRGCLVTGGLEIFSSESFLPLNLCIDINESRRTLSSSPSQEG